MLKILELYPILGCNLVKSRNILNVIIKSVIITKSVQRDLQKVPAYIALKLAAWVDAVAHDGLMEVRKIPGFHDEPLRGDRKGSALLG